MFENETFMSKKVRYIVSSIETMFFKSLHKKRNIPDYTIDEIADNIYISLKNIGVGKRPTIFICHSMGGLLGKKIINKLHKDVFINDIGNEL